MYMTLPSNVSFSTNTASKFKVKLMPHVVLSGPHWFVGMKSIAMPPLTLESRMAPLVGLDQCPHDLTGKKHHFDESELVQTR